MLIVFVYNSALAIIVATAIWAVRRDGRPRACLLAVATVGAASVVLAVGLADGPFRGLRLLAYGIFVFVALMLASCSVAIWRSHRRLAALYFAGFLLLEAVAVDAFLIEPHWLEVSRVRLLSDKIHRTVKVAILADLQTDEIGAYERSVIEKIVAEKPDLILLAGDYIQEARAEPRQQLQGELRRLLVSSGFSARLGCFAVRGNVDRDDWIDSFSGAEVAAVDDTRSFDAQELRITCLSMEDSFSPTLTVPLADQFHIVLGHCPNFALGKVAGDLLVAGHCHGGQVRLPGIGPLMTLSRVPRSWAAGVTHLDGDRTLIVSRGVGMERDAAPRLRFLCRPELVFVELAPL